jgi:hypothetical protein
MTSPGGIERGRVRIPIVPDFSDFPQDLRRSLRDAVNGLAAQVAVGVDEDALRDSVRSALSTIGSFQTTVTARADTSTLQRDITAALSGLGTSSIRISPSLDVRSLRRQLATLSSQDLRINVDVQGALDDLARVSRSIRTVARVGDQSLRVQVDIQADLARLRDLADVLNDIGRSRTITINATGNLNDVSRQVTNLSTLLANSVPAGGLIGAVATLAAAAVGITALGTAIAGASTAVLPLTGALAALGGVAATVGVGTSGVTEAVDALRQAENNAAAEAAAAARTREAAQRSLQAAQDSYARSVADAARQVETSNRQVAAAEQSVAAAQRDAQRAQRDLVAAREDAARQLEAYNDQLRDQSLNVRQAELSLKGAEQRLAGLQNGSVALTSPLDLDQAILDVDRARADLETAQQAATDLQSAAQEARTAGVDGADGVIAAQERLAAADQQVIDQQQALSDARSQAAQVAIDTANSVADAQQQVAAAQQVQADAVSAIGPSAAAAQASLDGLSASATAFALSASNVRDEWSGLGEDIQEALFSGLGSSLQGVSDNLLPELESGLPPIAAAVNDIADEFATFLADPETADALSQILSSVAEGLTVLAPTVGPVSAALLDLFTVAATSFPDLAPLIGDLALAFAGVVQNLVDTGLAGELTDAGIALLQAFTPEVLKAVTVLVPEIAELAIASADLLTEATPLIELFVAMTAGLLDIATGVTSGTAPALGDLADNALADVAGAIGAVLGPLTDLQRGFDDALSSVDGFVADGLSGLPDAARDAAFGLVDGLIDGIRETVTGGGIGRAMKTVVDEITAWLPGSPAEVGPLSGQGYSLYRGRALAEDFARGITSGVNLVEDAASVLASASVAGQDIGRQFESNVSATIGDLPPVTVKFLPEGVARQVTVGRSRLARR